MAESPHDGDTQIIDSCGNIFAYLGFPPEETEIYALRSDLMNHLEKILRERGWTPTEAAERLNIGRARANELMRGQWTNFSLDMLITLSARAGLKIRLELTETTEHSEPLLL
ncbi:MAG: XRE family transcriptional regulator [Methylococcaceae bacterium]|nr:XRE family transcriptional regulator [Methylococcaceae bacterium]